MSRSASAAVEAVRGIQKFAVFLSCYVVVLITAGALVKSLEAGLSVPDWPLSYGSLNPPRWWEIENVRAEHGHRLIAGSVALMTVALCVWIYRRETRRWVKRLSLAAVIAVLAQALLGGLTVLFFLPTAISASHAGLAQLFLCMIVTLAVVTSAAWPRDPESGSGRQLLSLAPLTTAAIYLQILIGAVMRHSGAGLAIPDFPLAFGRLVPPEFDFAVGIHFTHRMWGFFVAALVIATVLQAVRSGWAYAGIRIPSLALVVLVAGQITLGAFVVLTEKAVWVNTVHVGVGATILATSLVLTLNGWRYGRQHVGEPSGAPESTEGVAA